MRRPRRYINRRGTRLLERPRALGEGTAGVEVPEARGCGSRGTVAVINKQTLQYLVIGLFGGRGRGMD